MVSSKTIRNVAQHMEEQVHKLDKMMIEAQAVSPFAQQRRQMLASACEALRLETVRMDAGEEHVVGPDMFKVQGGSLDAPFGMSGEEV